MGKLKLTVNAEKTRICKVPEGEFDFLGFTFGRMYSPRTGQARLALRPSKKSIRRMIETIHALTIRSRAWQETTVLVPVYSVIGCQDRAAPADDPAAAAVRGELHPEEVLCRAAGLRLPVCSAILGGQDRAAVADDPAGRRPSRGDRPR